MHKVAVLVAAAPLLLAACGGGGGKSSSDVKLTPVAYVKQAAQKSAQATSERMVMTGNATTAQGKVDLSARGVFDNEKSLGSMELRINAAGVEVPFDIVLDKTTIYMKSPLMTDLPAGKTWAKIDGEKAAAAAGLDAPLAAADPKSQFERLTAIGKVTDIGRDTIDGAAVEHYRVEVDRSKVPKDLEGLGGGTEDIWIGTDDGYVRRVQANLEAGGFINFVVTFSDFGKDVTVDVPSASEAADMTNQSINGLGG
jgi:hypothetical protein